MKLILKDNQEIIVNHMNNVHSFEKLKDGQGNIMDVDSTVSFLIFDETSDFDEIKSKLTGSNITDFKLLYGNGTEKEFPGWKIKSLAEEISDERRVITIILGIA